MLIKCEQNQVGAKHPIYNKCKHSQLPTPYFSKMQIHEPPIFICWLFFFSQDLGFYIFWDRHINPSRREASLTNSCTRMLAPSVPRRPSSNTAIPCRALVFLRSTFTTLTWKFTVIRSASLSKAVRA